MWNRETKKPRRERIIQTGVDWPRFAELMGTSEEWELRLWERIPLAADDLLECVNATEGRPAHYVVGTTARDWLAAMWALWRRVEALTDAVDQVREQYDRHLYFETEARAGRKRQRREHRELGRKFACLVVGLCDRLDCGTDDVDELLAAVDRALEQGGADE